MRFCRAGSVSAWEGQAQTLRRGCVEFIADQAANAVSLCGAAKKTGKRSACPYRIPMWRGNDSGGEARFHLWQSVLPEIDVVADKEGGAAERAAFNGVFRGRHQALFHVILLGAGYQPRGINAGR